MNFVQDCPVVFFFNCIDEYREILQYIRTIEYNEEPQYDYIKGLLDKITRYELDKSKKINLMGINQIKSDEEEEKENNIEEIIENNKEEEDNIDDITDEFTIPTERIDYMTIPSIEGIEKKPKFEHIKLSRSGSVLSTKRYSPLLYKINIKNIK